MAAGRDPSPYIHAIERFATSTGLLPEQIWDQPTTPSRISALAGETGAAMPLVWAHAEYIKLVRSAADGRVFDLLAPVAERYLSGTKREPIEVWKFNRRVRTVASGTRLRIIAPEPFRLHWTVDEWQHSTDTDSTPTAIGRSYVDIPVAAEQRAPFDLRFTGPTPSVGRDRTTSS